MHSAFDDRALATDPAERVRKMGLMYNMRGTVNPVDGHYYGPNTVGVLGEVMKIFHEDGTELDQDSVPALSL